MQTPTPHAITTITVSTSGQDGEITLLQKTCIFYSTVLVHVYVSGTSENGRFGMILLPYILAYKYVALLSQKYFFR